MIDVLGNSEFFPIPFHQEFNSIILTEIISPHKIKREAKIVQASRLISPL